MGKFSEDGRLPEPSHFKFFWEAFVATGTSLQNKGNRVNWRSQGNGNAGKPMAKAGNGPVQDTV